jgi:hypothetical protein
MIEADSNSKIHASEEKVHAFLKQQPHSNEKLHLKKILEKKNRIIKSQFALVRLLIYLLKSLPLKYTLEAHYSGSFLKSVDGLRVQ